MENAPAAKAGGSANAAGSTEHFAAGSDNCSQAADFQTDAAKAQAEVDSGENEIARKTATCADATQTDRAAPDSKNRVTPCARASATCRRSFTKTSFGDGNCGPGAFGRKYSPASSHASVGSENGDGFIGDSSAAIGSSGNVGWALPTMNGCGGPCPPYIAGFAR